MSFPTQAVILCGGLGTRLRPFTNSLPKPMILCNGKPFLEYLLEQLAEQGIKRFCLLTGYLGEQIKDFFGNGSNWGWKINYSQGPVEWDTGRRIWQAKSELDQQFLLLYSDNFVPFSLKKLLSQHKRLKNPITLIASPKIPGNISLNEDGLVLSYHTKRKEDLPYVEIGYMVVERDQVLQKFPRPDCSFSEVLQIMSRQKQVGAWIQKDAYHSISDPNRWKKAEFYLEPKKIILIDRDGVINEKAAKGKYVNCWSEFYWIEQTRQKMQKLAQLGFRFIVITNQAGIGRGVTSSNEVEIIHQKMTQSFAEEGVEILQVYVCPHHWEVNCECRKPKPGMLLKASKDHLFRLDKSFFIGDDPRDMQAAESAGCKGVYWKSDLDSPDWTKTVLNTIN